MSMTNILDCPHCGRKVRIPEELADTTVKCPSCLANFVSHLVPPAENDLGASDLPSPVAQAPEVPVSPSSDPNMPQEVDSDMRPCARCGQPIPRRADFCQ